MRRSYWGLSDFERNELERQRRARNCLIAVIVGALLIGIISGIQ